MDEKEAQRRNIPLHVFNGFLEKLASDVEQELALLKAKSLPTAQHQATLDNLRRHQRTTGKTKKRSAEEALAINNERRENAIEEKDRERKQERK